jgi:hypothetical protein
MQVSPKGVREVDEPALAIYITSCERLEELGPPAAGLAFSREGPLVGAHCALENAPDF